MARNPGSATAEQNTLDHTVFPQESTTSGVSWAAAIAGLWLIGSPIPIIILIALFT